jgi:hypothetical protein
MNKDKNQATPEPEPDPVVSPKTVQPGQSCRDCPEWHTMKQKLRVSELLLKAIEGFESRMNAQDFKPTVAEYLKLLQMEQDLDATENSPKEIKVTWVEPAATSEPEK